MKNVHMYELSQTGPMVCSGRKLQCFSIFWKVFENEENHHIFTPGQQKYKIPLIWMKTVHMCELSQKRHLVHAVGDNFHYENMPI